MNFLNQHIDHIRSLCKTHNVKALYAFGSVLKENFTVQSDVDLIVSFGEIALLDYLDNYYNLKFSLEDILQRPVDLLEEHALKNPYFITAINKQRQLIYGD